MGALIMDHEPQIPLDESNDKNMTINYASLLSHAHHITPANTQHTIIVSQPFSFMQTVHSCSHIPYSNLPNTCSPRILELCSMPWYSALKKRRKDKTPENAHDQPPERTFSMPLKDCNCNRDHTRSSRDPNAHARHNKRKQK
jgi:hypothetical protein